MFLAEMTTEHFTFHALGKTKYHAKETMWKAWLAHCAEYKAADTFRNYDAMEEWYGVNVVELDEGQAARDFENLSSLS